MSKPYGLPEEEVVTRKVTGPNGVDYLLSMPGWYWNSLAWINDHTDLRATDMYMCAWRIAREIDDTYDIGGPGAFQVAFEGSLQRLIWFEMTDVINKANGISNDSINTKG
jgi:hypothetical protein